MLSFIMLFFMDICLPVSLLYNFSLSPCLVCLFSFLSGISFSHSTYKTQRMTKITNVTKCTVAPPPVMSCVLLFVALSESPSRLADPAHQSCFAISFFLFVYCVVVCDYLSIDGLPSQWYWARRGKQDWRLTGC
ncbi:hypothetical protein ASPZODRAFT_825784 [Penicilliopsis zonata CBS 506.65]|uniref:Uncharacterized protein n=1 Tax=Penicilliopsis zonata CBS 506.65 TaxID=1073090 RepID=A0A1L9SA86_9EURO|nr:hypothetical protein ASPZODRAFT_825784 [Penicilliopsis zonata CBS 506.65]OJJ44074.1 hypothetical protein ASPZODRAFT_825784 [Penicilliopsis zonata CBS 506.65]